MDNPSQILFTEIFSFLIATTLAYLILWLIFKLLKRFQIAYWIKGGILGLLIMPALLLPLVLGSMAVGAQILVYLLLVLFISSLPLFPVLLIYPSLVSTGGFINSPNILGFVLACLGYGLLGATIGLFMDMKKNPKP